MKERLFAILLAVALLFAAAPLRPAVPSGLAAPVIVPDADCQGGGQCTN